MKRINKWKTRIKIKYEQSLIKKCMLLKKEIKDIKKELRHEIELKKEITNINHGLIDLLAQYKIDIRELKLGERN